MLRPLGPLGTTAIAGAGAAAPPEPATLVLPPMAAPAAIIAPPLPASGPVLSGGAGVDTAEVPACVDGPVAASTAAIGRAGGAAALLQATSSSVAMQR